MILEIGALFIAIGVIMMALGYNLKLPGYSRQKMLEGHSVYYQMLDRRELGNTLMKMGVATMLSSVFLAFIMFGLFLSVRTVEITPRKVDILIAQGKTVVIADGKVQEFSGAHYHIRRIYSKQEFNAYGFECPGSTNELIMEDQQDQWEELRR